MATDAEQCAILRAELELQTLEILLSVLPLTQIAHLRCEGAIEAVRFALEFKRAEIGLPLGARAA